ncbi:MAG TPA: zinc ribbon domain-containing protein [Candidatus Atribacteria bacterium]|nr:zinc ribbon domain-containing protein [Candidatus Atribacteria bacterium]
MPRKVKYVCKNCGHKFELDIYSEEEAKDHNRILIQPECPRCHSIDLERRS